MIQRNIGVPRNRVHLVQRHEKQMFAKTGAQPCILIDDYSRNTKEFSNERWCRYHISKCRTSYRELKKLGLILVINNIE